MNRAHRTGLVMMVATFCSSVGLAAEQGAAHPKQVPRSVPRPALIAPPSQYHALPRVDTLLVGATVLDGAGGRIGEGDVLIRDGRIAAVGQRLSQEKVLIIDARGRWVTPGIIDIHTHYGTYLLPQTAAESNISDVLEDSDPNVADTWIEPAPVRCSAADRSSSNPFRRSRWTKCAFRERPRV